MKYDIYDIKTWPPGSMIIFDNSRFFNKLDDTFRRRYVGIVISSDGDKHITVLWNSNQLRELDIEGFNINFIKRVTP